MKILLLILFPIACIGQTDSLEIKLQKYKQLYEQKLIDSAEYKELKKGVFTAVKPAQPPDLKLMKKQGKSQITAGGILLHTGAAFLVWGTMYRSVQNDVKQEKLTRGILIGLGCVQALVGGGLLGSGINKLHGRKEKFLEPL